MSRTRIDPSLLNNLSSNLNMGGNKIVNAANGTTSTDLASFGQLKVIQVGVPFVDTGTTTNVTTNTYTDTTTTVSITPTSASNRILIEVSGKCYVAVNTGNTILDVQIVRGAGTVVQEFRGALNGPTTASQTGSVEAQCFFQAIDSPATTSSVSYKIQIKNSTASSTVAWNRPSTSSSVIRLTEVV